MKTVRPTSSPTIFAIDDGTPSNASADWFVVALAFGAAIAAFFYFRVPQNFDFNSPDFNPFVLLPPVLALFGVWYLVRAIRATLIGRRFGRTVFEMEGETVALGGTLKGLIRCSRELSPTSDYKIGIQCVEAIRGFGIGQKDRTIDHIRWEALRKVDPRSVDAKAGIPVEFTLPVTALAHGDSRAEGDVRWVVTIDAPMQGTDFSAIFPIYVLPRKS
jgi:hypothetical protein